jgi:DNA topoisomerase-1
MDIRWGRYGKYLRCSSHPECQGTLNFKRDDDGRVIPVFPEDTGEVCEKCGAPMIVKRGRFGEFLACSKYPECENTRRLRKKVDALCPKCGGQVVQIPGKGRGRRPFYGCANYPNCDFTASAEPINETCPQCGANYLVKSRKGKKCAQKGCGYEG